MTILTVIACLIGILAALILAFLIFWRFWFLRDPERKIPSGNNIVSPADGKIIQIVDLDNVEELKIKKGLIGKIRTLCSDVGDSCYLISIFMSPLSVHLQRASIDGEVLSVKHKDGQFGVTMSFENGILNEKAEILIKNSKIGKFKIIQIAGIMVRRIETWVRPKQKVKKGEKIGRINFGSQVSIILPKRKVKLLIKNGEKVYAGSTILAEIK